MGREQTSTIEQEVRRVLGDVLSEVADELGAEIPEEPSGSGKTNGAARSFSSAGRAPGRGSNGSGGETVPPDVLDAVKSLYRDLQADQASTLAEMFEAIASILQGVYARGLQGNAASAYALQRGAAARQIAEQAWATAAA